MTPAALAARAAGDHENFLVASIPGGIEAQEKMGQFEQSIKSTLPKDLDRPSFEKMGFVFGEPADDLFVNVTFPPGWSKKPTDHSMWSDIVDDQGKKRGGIFYKAAFYDRKADVNFLSRYNYTRYAPTDSDTRYRVVVQDGGTRTVAEIGNWSRENYDGGDMLEKLAINYLDKHYPQWRDVHAYWNEIPPWQK